MPEQPSLLAHAARMIISIFMESAPWLLFGLALVGIMQVLFRAPDVQRHLGKRNLRSAVLAWLFGLPLPVCSCGVVPLTLGLREKRASREALLAFLIGTPENSIGTFAITWGLLGPLMTVVRPLASMLSAVLAAVFSIADRTDRDTSEEESEPIRSSEADELESGVGLSGLLAALRGTFGGREQTEPDDAEARDEPNDDAEARDEPSDDAEARDEPSDDAEAREELDSSDELHDDSEAHVHRMVARPTLKILAKQAYHYGFVHMLDSISIWFVSGVIVAGLITALVPASWIENLPGGELGGMLLVLLISIPLYSCAVESTPVAAALLLTGLSPGAALVLLLAGPATNLTSLVLLYRHMGRRFVVIYLTAVASGAILSGLALNLLVALMGFEVGGRVASFGEVSGTWGTVKLVSSVILVVLVLISFARLDWREELGDFGKHLGWFARAAGRALGVLGPRRGIGWRLVVLALIIIGGWMLTGFQQVPRGSVGFRVRLGQLVERDITAGLHYHWPWPIERIETYGVSATYSLQLGYRSDSSVLSERSQKMIKAARIRYGWHSYYTTINSQPEESLYLMGDENQLEAKFAVHYRIVEPEQFYFEHGQARELVALATESVTRRFMASARIDEVLAPGRRAISETVVSELQELVDEYRLGIEVLDVHVVDLHPPADVIKAFRDVASAMEDRQTKVHMAHVSRSREIPVARGRAAKLLASAEGDALDAETDGLGEAEHFELVREAFSEHPDATMFRMRLQAMEKALPGVDRYIVPPEAARGGDLRLWNAAAARAAPSKVAR